MADEAEEIIDEIEEQDEEVVADVDASLDEFQKLLDGAPEEEVAAETAQAEGVEQSAEGDAVETEEVVETPAVADEGPSFLMKQEAVRAGIPVTLIEFCRDDRQLEQMIAMAAPVEEQTAESDEDSPYKFLLPEDEFGADDPVAKQIRALVDAATADRKALKAEIAKLKDDHDQREREALQSAYESLYSPLDDYLDDLQDPRFGNFAKGLTPLQQRERREVAARYQGLGAKPETPAEQKRRKVELALSDYAPDVIEKRNKQKQPPVDQRRQVLGGGAKRTPQARKSEADLLDDWDKALRGQKPLLN
jgi:hypothetical protein